MSPYSLVFGKTCHLPIKLEHRALWEIKKLNFDFQAVGEKRLLQLNKLEEIGNESYENAHIYKDRRKKWHDKHLMLKKLKKGDRVLLFNFKLRLFPGKLKSRWARPFIVISITRYGAIGLISDNWKEFKVNGQHLKHYFGEELASKESIKFKE